MNNSADILKTQMDSVYAMMSLRLIVAWLHIYASVN